MSRGHEAAAASQAMQDALSDIDDIAARYVRLRLAHTLLRAAGTEHGNALVVNMASLGGKSPQPWLSVYSATKAAVIAYTRAMNKGGSQKIGEVTITMTHAVHSCGILDDGKIIYGGEAVGYVITFSNGVKVYHAGDTAVFGDMRLIGEVHRPSIAFLPIGDRFTMGPR